MTAGAADLPVVTLAEWQQCELPGQCLNDEDRALVRSLSGEGNSRVMVDELRAGLRIVARSWVGVVRFSSFELRITPKLAGGETGLARLIDYAAGLDAFDRYDAVHTFTADRLDLLDLIALLLAESCEKILRQGLYADYQETERDLPVLRGRLLPRKQLLNRFGRVDRLECRFDEHTTDIPENQLLLAALHACRPRVRDPEVVRRVHRALAAIGGHCSLAGIDLRLMRQTLTYDRLNEHYRPSHALAWLILDVLGVEDLYSGGRHRAFAFLLDMNRLFERFVERWLRLLLTDTDLQVTPQHSDRSILWDVNCNRPHGSIRPDIVIRHRSRPQVRLPLDAKYKLYDQKRLDPADIYQSFVYAFAYGRQHAVVPRGLILYPASSTAKPSSRLQVRRDTGLIGAELEAVGIYIPSAVDAGRRPGGSPQGQTLLATIHGCLAPPLNAPLDGESGPQPSTNSGAGTASPTGPGSC